MQLTHCLQAARDDDITTVQNIIINYSGVCPIDTINVKKTPTIGNLPSYYEGRALS
jgi:hypothetical protein